MDAHLRERLNSARDEMAASSDLVRYNSAKRALAEAVRIDEVKDIRDKAVAMRTYAYQAKDRALIDLATEIRLRAERRAGELLTDMEKNKGAVPGKTGRKGKPVLDSTPKLSELNINKSQSARWQKLAAVSDNDFEELVQQTKQKASAAVDRAQQPKPKPRHKQRPKTDPADVAAACVLEVETIVRAAIAGMDADERAGLFGQLERAIHVIVAEAAAQDADKADRRDMPPLSNEDRWIETDGRPPQ
jgi:hypothetical protein